ncbi:MAG: hypothetical protein H6739_24235 [Alphaproteobacteria bacterium]|nr:hypothetical protein [Alphaproteobacteria bacterium]MCB9762932.1 hypothetical protein [Alphaproteobacteria bacterium]
MFLTLCAVALAHPGDARDVFKHPLGGPSPAAPQGLMQEGWDLLAYDMEHRFDLDEMEVSGVITAAAQARRASPGPLTLHADGPRLASVTVDGQPADVGQSGDTLSVATPGGLREGAVIEVRIAYTADLQEEWDTGVSWDGRILSSFHEPEGARRWLVVYDDPADKVTFTWAITVPDGLTVAANGVLEGVSDNGDGTATWRWAFDQPIPTYLIALHASAYARVDQQMSDGRPITHYVPPFLRRDAEEDLASTPEILDLLASRFGPYPWPSYGNAVCGIGGAMEHTTMTSFGQGLIGSGAAEWVNVHEAAHHWFGDWVTLTTWPQIWLNEGFASYAEVLWAEHLGGEAGRRDYVASQEASYLGWREYEGVFALSDPDYYWGGTVYDKGAVVLDMLRTQVGDEAFFAGLVDYTERYGGANATIDDFRGAVEGASGQDLGWFFDQWVHRPGEPSFEVRQSSQVVAEGVTQLDVVVTQRTAETWRVPVELALAWADGGEQVEDVWIEAPEQRLTFCLDEAPAAVRFDPDRKVLQSERRRVLDMEPLDVVCVEPGETPTPSAGDAWVVRTGCGVGGGGGWAALLALLTLRRRQSAN